MNTNTLIWLIAGAAVVAVFYSQTQQAAQATPLAIYPSLAYTNVTSMAQTPQQKASAAVAPTSLFTSVQQQEQAALLSQCAGSYPYCTPLMGDTQLGL